MTIEGEPRAVSHAWNPIADVSDGWEAFARADLDETLGNWESEWSSLRDPTKVARLHERLAVRWAIETGVLEKLYTIDRGVTESLVELGLGAVEQFTSTGDLSRNAVKMISDQRAALDFLFQYIKEERQLSLSYIKELHQLLLQNQFHTEAVDQFGTKFQTEVLKGKWKEFPNNPVTIDGSIHEYCPPDFVQDEMEQLLALHESHNAKGVRPEVEAAWLHHRFTEIHPFQDGNGRVARALATLVFLKKGFLPLVIRASEHKDTYLDALARADAGDLSPLVNLFANIQATDLEDAITFVREIRGEGIRALAVSAAEAAKRRLQQDEETIARATDKLLVVTQERLAEVATELQQAFTEVHVDLDAIPFHSNDANEAFWSQQIIKAAQQYGYFADLGRFRKWVQLRLHIRSGNVPKWHIVVSFHHKESRAGLMAAVAFLTTSESDYYEARPVIIGTSHEFTYSAGSRLSEDEFRLWLEAAVQRLLEEWQSRV
jgi:Fic family protein